jgi:4-amino-4-deoxy-L-arabinose transferase-like glycosyltransferase
VLKNRVKPQILIVAAVVLGIVVQVLLVEDELLVLALILYLVAAGLAVYAFTGEEVERKPLRIEVEAALVVCILLVGAFFRVYQITSLPHGCHFDEAVIGLASARIMEGGYRPVYVTGASENAALLFYLNALSFKLFGVNIVALRLVSVLGGTLTLLALYLLVRLLFDYRVALLSTFFLAVSRWHVTFSRYGWINIQTPLFTVLTFYFLIRGLRSRKRLDFILSGVALGICFNSYAPGRLVPLMVLGFLLFKALTRKGFVRDNYREIALLLLAVLVVCLPLIFFIVQNPGVFMRRVRAVSIWNDIQRVQSLSPLWHNISKHALMFHYRGAWKVEYNLPYEPMLDFFSGIFFLFGLGYSLYRWRKPEHFLLLLWFAISMLAGILSSSHEAPQALRVITAIPVVYVFAGLFLERAWTELQRDVSRERRRGLLLGLAVLLAIIANANYQVYFVRWAEAEPVWGGNFGRVTQVGQFIDYLGDGHHVYLSDPFYGALSVEFTAYNAPEYERFDRIADLPARETGDRDVAYVLDVPYEQMVPLLRRYYPHGGLVKLADPYGRPAFIAYLVDREEVIGVQGLTGRYYAGEGWEGEPLLERRDPSVSFDWGTEGTPVPAPFSVEWRGLLSIPEYGSYTLGLESLDRAQLFLDEALLLESRGGYVEKGISLAKGLHPIEVRAVERSGSGRVKLYWASEAGPRETIPPSMLYASSSSPTGLLGRYYEGTEWAGKPVLVQVVPAILAGRYGDPVPKPASVEWVGRLRVAVPGEYTFVLKADQPARLEIGGLILDNEGQPQVEGSVRLSAGLHDIELRFIETGDYYSMELYWTPPGGEKELVPAEVLIPW